MRVRKATQTDVGPIAHVHVTAWQACYRGLMPDEFLDRLSSSEREAIWRNTLDAAGCVLLVCRSERRTVGFAACGPTRDQDKDASLVGELYVIYVLPDFWGRGCGYALERVEKEIALAKFEELNVWVLDANARARQFYEREGCRMNTNAGKMLTSAA